MNISDAIQILRKHNISGASVLRITEGKVTEHELLEQILNACDQFVAEREEYKRLLKAAVEDFKVIGKALDADCDILINCEECPLQSGHYNCRSWNHQDEALALIGEDTNAPATEDDTNVGHKRRTENGRVYK